MFRVDKERFVNRLSARNTRRKERSFHRPSLTDCPILVNDKRIKDSVGRRAEVNLWEKVHTVPDLRINTVLFGPYL